MAETQAVEVFLAKARESLAGAQSEMVSARYNNSVNRSYYACFQAAVAALLRDGVAPSGVQWQHRFVQSQFVGQLINRRKRFPAELRNVLERLFALRRIADYGSDHVSAAHAARAFRRADGLLSAIATGGSIR